MTLSTHFSAALVYPCTLSPALDPDHCPRLRRRIHGVKRYPSYQRHARLSFLLVSKYSNQRRFFYDGCLFFLTGMSLEDSSATPLLNKASNSLMSSLMNGASRQETTSLDCRNLPNEGSSHLQSRSAMQLFISCTRSCQGK